MKDQKSKIKNHNNQFLSLYI